jgi:hypothetical protein
MLIVGERQWMRAGYQISLRREGMAKAGTVFTDL